MLNSIKKCGKVIAKELAIAFFFVSLVILAFNFIFKDTTSTYIKLFNKVAVANTDNKQTNNTLPKIDSETKKLTNIPAYGESFGTITIPDIDITINFYNGDSLAILKKGAGRYIGSYFPGEGKPIIVAAHSNLTRFGYLYKLNTGAKINVDTYYGKYVYEVVEGKIINANVLNQSFNEFLEQDEEIIMLYTCYPSVGIQFKTDRYVVYAKKVSGSSL